MNAPLPLNSLLSLHGVHVHIGAYHILHGVDFTVPEGQITLLLGRNGAGKTTTLRALMGLWRVSAGRVVFDGREVHDLPTPDLAGLGIAYVPENMGIFADLSVRENLLLAARGARTLNDIDTDRLEWIFRLFPAMKTFWRHPAGKLSGGQKQMLAISRAIVEPRRLLLVDELSKGLAPAIVNHLIDALSELKAAGTTILLVEQNLHFARELGDQAVVMDDGRVVHVGHMNDLVSDLHLQRRLLGLSMTADPVGVGP